MIQRGLIDWVTLLTLTSLRYADVLVYVFKWCIDVMSEYM